MFETVFVLHLHSTRCCLFTSKQPVARISTLGRRYEYRWTHMQLPKIPCNSKHRLNNDNVGRIHVSQCHKSNESLWKESISKFLSGRYVLICGYSPKFHPIWRYSYSHLNMNVVAFEDLCRLPRRCTSSQARLLIAGVRMTGILRASIEAH